jgi:hypothetical protein
MTKQLPSGGIDKSDLKRRGNIERRKVGNRVRRECRGKIIFEPSLLMILKRSSEEAIFFSSDILAAEKSNRYDQQVSGLSSIGISDRRCNL